MKKLEARDLKDLNLLKHYRIIRKLACKNNGLTDAELELIIYLDCIDLFTKKIMPLGRWCTKESSVKCDPEKKADEQIKIKIMFLC